MLTYRKILCKLFLSPAPLNPHQRSSEAFRRRSWRIAGLKNEMRHSISPPHRLKQVIKVAWRPQILKFRCLERRMHSHWENGHGQPSYSRHRQLGRLSLMSKGLHLSAVGKRERSKAQLAALSVLQALSYLYSGFFLQTGRFSLAPTRN